MPLGYAESNGISRHSSHRLLMNPIRVDSVPSLLVGISKQIYEYGWALIVTPYGDYLHHFTLGLEYRWQHADLETFALDEGRGAAYLSALVERIRNGTKYRNGDFVHDLVPGFDMFLMHNPSDPDGAPTTDGRLRLVWPDARYRYPWHKDCESRCAAQAIIPPPTDLDMAGLQAQLSVMGTIN